MEDFEPKLLDNCGMETDPKYVMALFSHLDFLDSKHRWVRGLGITFGLYDNVVEINIKKSNEFVENINKWLLDNGGKWSYTFNFENFAISFNFEDNNTAILFKLVWG